MAIDVPADSVGGFDGCFMIASKSLVFTRSKRHTKAEDIVCDGSAESILIPIESNWIQTLFGL